MFTLINPNIINDDTIDYDVQVYKTYTVKSFIDELFSRVGHKKEDDFNGGYIVLIVPELHHNKRPKCCRVPFKQKYGYRGTIMCQRISKEYWNRKIIEIKAHRYFGQIDFYIKLKEL
jgi:hypothetical protein